VQGKSQQKLTAGGLVQGKFQRRLIFGGLVQGKSQQRLKGWPLGASSARYFPVRIMCKMRRCILSFQKKVVPLHPIFNKEMTFHLQHTDTSSDARAGLITTDPILAYRW
jgi:hypothetical protein